MADTCCGAMSLFLRSKVGSSLSQSKLLVQLVPWVQTNLLKMFSLSMNRASFISFCSIFSLCFTAGVLLFGDFPAKVVYYFKFSFTWGLRLWAEWSQILRQNIAQVVPHSVPDRVLILLWTHGVCSEKQGKVNPNSWLHSLLKMQVRTPAQGSCPLYL